MSSRFCAVSSQAATPVAGGDLTLACQYHDLSGGQGLSGEQRLMLALLADAINVYQKGALSRISEARRLYVDAERWIMAATDEAGGLSFATVCEALAINPDLLRRRLIGWKHAVGRQCVAHPSPGLKLMVVPHVRPNSHRRGRPPSAVRAIAAPG